jgi:16S rRNA (uracil1498-N3)-methyltransferase
VGVPPSALWLAVGPEGGFSDAEIAVARAAGWQVLDLGPRILRVETAAICLAVVVACVAPGRIHADPPGA